MKILGDNLLQPLYFEYSRRGYSFKIIKNFEDKQRDMQALLGPKSTTLCSKYSYATVFLINNLRRTGTRREENKLNS